MDPTAFMTLLQRAKFDDTDLHWLMSPIGDAELEALALKSSEITRQRFGNTITMYAPLYLSNECVNQCVYCGFNTANRFDRTTLSMEEVLQEALSLRAAGFGHILLLTGEHPGRVPVSYIEEAIVVVKKVVPQVSVEVYPMDESAYRRLVAAGCDGITIYQETYNQATYAQVHKRGPKSNFAYRYGTPLRAARAGMRGVGLGFLIGLAPVLDEMVAMVAHAREVLRHDWRVRLAFSFPRLRPHEGGYVPEFPVSDRELAQMIFALRLLFPDAELVLSTRESKTMRDGLIPLGITRVSAGSSTEPGGYSEKHGYGEQFAIDDARTPEQMADLIERMGFEPVWKDWDWAYGERGAQ